MPTSRRGVDRRQFLRVGALAGAASALPLEGSGHAAPPAGTAGAALVSDPADPVAAASPVQWAADFLLETCRSRGLTARACRRVEDAGPAELCILAAGSGAPVARELLRTTGAGALDTPESFAIAPVRYRDRALLLATAPDALGLVYALTELADRTLCATEPLAALRVAAPIVDRPVCRIRSVMRLFASDVEDKGWLHDRSFWRQYLTMLVTQRFNRINLALGLGYDFARQLRDTYLYFAYPFLVSVPGYDVRAAGLDDTERARNLESLRFISEEAARRGLHFQLGLWTHAFQWTDSPDVNYTIEGLTSQTQAAYCRDALRTLLEACPAIKGVTIRTHGESGVPEGDAGRYDFWQTLFSGVARAGRPLEIDLHAKGVDQRIIDIALATGLPVRVSPKFWAEHTGLPYLQSSIRALELPTDEPSRDSLMALSTGTRNHMRYSYGDLLMKGRRYGIVHRVWPGTQRLLLSGDPASAAELGRAFSAFGADGVEFIEPLSFKGRKGSGLPGGRDAYADASLRPRDGDWRKFSYTYRLWGRLAYNPDCDPEAWRRQLRREFGAAAEAIESGLARSSRILPLITTAHCPSAANNNYWPEIYSNMSIFDGSDRGSYSDTPAPKVFNTVSSLDPQLFASVDEYAESLLAQKPLGKITPVAVAGQLDEWARSSAADLARADGQIADRRDPAYRRLIIDCAIAAGLGRFFARKLRAAVLYAIFDRTGAPHALKEALDQYRQARQIWADFAAGPAGAYVRDITFGYAAHLRGHWQDRLPAIDKDIAAMEGRVATRRGGAAVEEAAAAAIAAVLTPAPTLRIPIEHTPRASFRAGEALPVVVRAPGEATGIGLVYRHLDQAETYRSLDMRREGGAWTAQVPADYTQSPYPLQYYFEVRAAAGLALWPGFKSDFLGRPYFVAEPL